MEPIPLFGAGTRGKSSVVTAQRRVNIYTEFRPDSDKTRVAHYGTPGLEDAYTISPAPDGPTRGTYDRTANFYYIVAGTSVYKYTTSHVLDTQFTGLLTSSGPVSMADNGLEVLLVDGTAGYILSNATTAGGTITQIADADFPNGARTCTFADGFFVADDPVGGVGRFKISASYDGSTWAALDFATAESSPDAIVAVDTYNGLIPFFGTRSLEFWGNTGGTDFPFEPLRSATQQWGLAAQSSPAHLDNTIYFLAANRQGSVQVMFLNGYVPERASDFDTENIINGFSTVSNAVGGSYLLDGHAMYVLNFPTAGRTFLYDATMKVWSELAGGDNAQLRHRGQHYFVVEGQTYVTDYETAAIYKLVPTTYTDSGDVLKRVLQTRHILQGHNVLGIDELYLDMETGVGLSGTGQGSDPEIMLQVSKDGGRTWGVERWAKLGKIGEYKAPRVIWRRLGSGRDFTFRFMMTDAVKFVITGGAITPRVREQ